VGTDGNGLSGLEHVREDQLRGRNGLKSAVLDALGDPLSVLDVKRVRHGDPLRTTLEFAIQAHAEYTLALAAQRSRARAACALVVDASGQVLTLAQWPPVKYRDVPAVAGSSMLATSLTFAPGRTLKPLVSALAAAAGLEPGSSPPETLNLLSRRLGPQELNRRFRRLGFGKPTGIELSGEEPGKLVGADVLGVTPLQLTAGYASLLGGGRAVRPRLLLGRRPGAGELAFGPGAAARALGVSATDTTLTDGRRVTASATTGPDIAVLVVMDRPAREGIVEHASEAAVRGIVGFAEHYRDTRP
jgi:cell division protein FtsI (penicillin-binding protein 3)